MIARLCPVCGGPMLTYLSPLRLLCPRLLRHDRYMVGPQVGKSTRRRESQDA